MFVFTELNFSLLDSTIHTVSVKLADIIQEEELRHVKVIVSCTLGDLVFERRCQLVKERIEMDTIYYRFGALLVDDSTGDELIPTTATQDSEGQEEKDLISFDNDLSGPPITTSSGKAHSSMSPLSAIFIPSSQPQSHQTPAKSSPGFISIGGDYPPLYATETPYHSSPAMKVPLFRPTVQPNEAKCSTYSHLIQPPTKTTIAIKSPPKNVEPAPLSVTSSPLNAKVKSFIPSLPPSTMEATEESKGGKTFNVNAVIFTPNSPISSSSLQQTPVYKRSVSSAIRISKPLSSVDSTFSSLNDQASPFTPSPSLTTAPVVGDEEQQLASPALLLNPEIAQLPSSTPIRMSKPPTTRAEFGAPTSPFNVKAMSFIPSTSVKSSAPGHNTYPSSSQLNTKASLFVPPSRANTTLFNVHAEAFNPATTSSTSGSASSSIASTPLHSKPSSPLSIDKPTATSDDHVPPLHLASEPTTRLALHPSPYSPDLINL